MAANRITWTPLVLPLLAGGIALAFVPTAKWASLTSSILPALSVVGAAVLVRLARGLPFTNPDHFGPGEAEKITAALKAIARSLRTLIVIVLATMLAIVFAPTLVELGHSHLPGSAGMALDGLASFILGAALSYVFVRVVQVVNGDLSLLDVQSDVILKAIARKQAGAVDKSLAEGPKFQTPKGFGATMPEPKKRRTG